MLICHANNELIHSSIVHRSLEELLDDSLVRKLSKFTSKNVSNNPSTKELCNTGSFAFSRGEGGGGGGFDDMKRVCNMEVYRLL